MRFSRFVATLLGAAAALAMIGCGSATSPTDSTASAASEASAASGSATPDAEGMRAFSQCMRDNGVPDFPDPKDGGVSLAGSGVDVDSPAFKAAEKACESAFPREGVQPERPANSEWKKIVPGGRCRCADGSRFLFWVRDADPAKVVFYLDGGGACWDAGTCAFTEEEDPTYDWHISSAEDPALDGGIFDLDHADNPFADYSFVYVPYCTGDVHLGARTREYSPGLTVQHKGFVNAGTALSRLVRTYPDADDVVVVGLSAGSVAAPVYGGLVSDALPNAQLTVLAVGSGAYPDDPDINAEILGRWGAFETMPDWEVNQGLKARDWSIPGFWVQAGLHDPEIVMGRFDYAFDETQARYMRLLGLNATNVLASIDTNEAAIEDAGVVQHSYTAPGTDHGIVLEERFYTMTVSGVELVDWVEALIATEPLDDVRCNDCANA